MIQDIFEFCCYWIAEVGIQFNLSYYAINIIVFCYIEPFVTGFMIGSALFALIFRNKITININIWLFRIFVITVIAVFALSIPQALEDLTFYNKPLDFLQSTRAIKESNPVILEKFNFAVNELKEIAKNYNTTYEVVNIVIYVIILPFSCIVSYFILRYAKTRN